MTYDKAERLQSKLPVIKVEHWDTGKKQNLPWESHSFIHGDDDEAVLKLSAEDTYSSEHIADYWRYWINPVLMNWADKHGMYWEWQNPGCIALYPA